jgi:hypothetical protein
MPEKAEHKTAKQGDLVALDIGEYDVVNDGKGLRVCLPSMVSKTYNRDGVLARKVQLEAELELIAEVLAEMDKLGVV